MNSIHSTHWADLIRQGILGMVLSGWIGLAAGADTEGIFADFTTSLGDFTCRLHYAEAPQAAANWIGLATGDRSWIHPATGQVRSEPFYDGLTFHRVIPGFMIQGGSPNGLGTDGPGYAFPDEFYPSLKHDAAGVLSMANSGPDSNGAQFFITVTNTPWLDGVHTVFGRVISGLPVVHAISQVARDSSNKPLTNVTITRVAIRRVGQAAQAFDIHAQNLPAASSEPLRIEREAGAVSLRFDLPLHSHHFLAESADLAGWSYGDLGIEVAPSGQDLVARTAADAARFFTLSRVQYPGSTFAPRTLHGRTLTLAFLVGGNLRILFDQAGGGTYDYSGTPGTVRGYLYNQGPYRGSLWPIQYSGLVPMRLQLYFTSDSAGTFSGTAYADQPFSVSGQFTLAGP
ncbi:MAG TPA: peptidylprolyl isomerase [Candidatus Paceibacterota bacterium]|nr:peptidylprolyl isomerase [Verrucomicrobiota bacterium]HRZ47034.1 peptidylprolyl isomerase [Candidatus Paceibacterota bacterium]HRZ93241.1 peptidylprolyl isomerase [Candidatus Paceibacterota bacterium]